MSRSSFITTAISLARCILLLLRTHSIVCRHFSSTSLGPILSLSQLNMEFSLAFSQDLSLLFRASSDRPINPSCFKFVHPSDIGHISTLFRSFFIYSCDMSICFWCYLSFLQAQLKSVFRGYFSDFYAPLSITIAIVNLTF
jgi:hypothetical protein